MKSRLILASICAAGALPSTADAVPITGFGVYGEKSVTIGLDSRVNGLPGSNRDVTFGPKDKTGDVAAGGTFSPGAGSIHTLLSPHGVVTLPGASWYGALEVKPNAKLALGGGSYDFDSVLVGGYVDSDIDLSAGPLRIHVVGAMRMGEKLKSPLTGAAAEALERGEHAMMRPPRQA